MPDRNDSKYYEDMYSMYICNVSQKGVTKLVAVTSSNLNRFLKFFYHWKEKEISNIIHVLFLTTPYVCCHTTFGN